MLRDYIKEDSLMACKMKTTDWEDTVNKGCELLQAKDYINDQYAGAIIEMTKEHGPYYVICPGVAMPHSRPEAGVQKKGISLMTLETPIEFGSEMNDPVSVVITLAATDNQTHLDLMQEIVVLLSEQENVDRLTAATSVEEIIEIIS